MCISVCIIPRAVCVCVGILSLSLQSFITVRVEDISLPCLVWRGDDHTLPSIDVVVAVGGGPPPVSSLLCVPLCACAPAHLLVGRRHFTRTKKRVHTQQCVDSAVTITPPLHTAVTVETKRIPTPTHRLAGGYSFVDDEAKRDGCTKTTSTARSPLWPARCAPCVGIPPTA